MTAVYTKLLMRRIQLLKFFLFIYYFSICTIFKIIGLSWSPPRGVREEREGKEREGKKERERESVPAKNVE